MKILFRFGIIVGIVLIGWHFGKAFLLPQKKWPETQLFTPITVTGWIEGLPQLTPETTRFLLQTDRGLLQLTWYGHTPVDLAPGQYWQLQVKLKPPRGLINPGLPNSAIRQQREGILAVGYLYHDQQQLLRSSPWRSPLDYLRSRLRQQLLQSTQGFANQGILLALTLGDQSRITQDQWQVFRNTGTNHLVAIAGLHMGIICGVLWFLMRWLWGGVPWLTKRYPAQSAAWVASLSTGILYSALAGFSIPTQRAVIMLCCLTVGQLLKKPLSAYGSLCLSFIVVITWNPWNIFAAGTWLSFGAVGLLIYCFAGRVGQTSKWKHWIAPQWVMAIGLIPLTAFWFGQVSLIGWIANIIAIPWLTFLLLPWLLLATITVSFWPALAHCILFLCQYSLQGLIGFLSLLGHWQFASINLPPTSILIAALASIGCLILLAPKSIPGRYLGILLLLPLWLRIPPTPAVGEVWFTVLDVGQGLATVIQTHSHTLVYDTGPSDPEGFNAGEAVVLPYLHYRGIFHLDKLVVSHGDNDHSGGAEYLLQNIPVDSFDTSALQLFSKNHATACLPNHPWQWDQVTFEYLDTGDQLTGNNRSCVLKITAGKQAILLPGDIEKPAEQNMVMFHASQLPATILVAPHHGSKTSSSIEFVKAVDPKIVIFSTGFYNKFHFPNPLVEQRYQAIGATELNTANGGAVVEKIGIP